ncbi:MAG: NrdH-redoxin [Spirochaetae bacterium HGW-Spirochaetae-6]|nr:MAG: NrdH-redoxin [Spirochaetae bacterium HGW-Spirochaetae-6]
MQIKVYTTPTCHFCQKVKDYLKAKNVAYSELDVSKNPQYAQEMVQKSGQMGVPVVLLGNQIVVGFDKPKIDKILNLN